MESLPALCCYMPVAWNMLQDKRCSQSLSFSIYPSLPALFALRSIPKPALIMWAQLISCVCLGAVRVECLSQPPSLCILCFPVSADLSSHCHPPLSKPRPTCFLLDSLSIFPQPHFSRRHPLGALQTPALIYFSLLLTFLFDPPTMRIWQACWHPWAEVESVRPRHLLTHPITSAWFRLKRSIQ